MKKIIKCIFILTLLSANFSVFAQNQKSMAIKAMTVDKVYSSKQELVIDGKTMKFVAKDKSELAFMFADAAQMVNLKDVTLGQQYYFLLYKEESAFNKGRNEFNQIVAIYNKNPMDEE